MSMLILAQKTRLKNLMLFCKDRKILYPENLPSHLAISTYAHAEKSSISRQMVPLIIYPKKHYGKCIEKKQLR
jgi:hypothetical protein